METEDRKKNSYRLVLKFIIVFIIVVITLFNIIGTWFWFNTYRIEQRKKEVPVFLHQIIRSLKSDLDFYKKHSAESAIDDLQILKNNLNKIEGPNDIFFIDYDIGLYEYKIMFNAKDIFKADVFFIDGQPVLGHFLPLPENHQ